MVDKKLVIKIVFVLLSITLVGIVVGIIVSNSGGGGDNNKFNTIERVANNRYYSYAKTVLTGTKGLIPSPNALQLDYIDQLIGRTQSIGSMNYIRELIGFNWIPGWNEDPNGNIKPNTIGVDGYNLPGEYSWSGFTTLGTILWVLDPLGPKSENHAKNWTDIKINESF